MKQVEDIISEVAGADVLPIVKALKNKKNISEFKIALELKEEVNTVRNKLYRLYNSNLVTFIRKKDKIKGWYIYYWTFNDKRIESLEIELKKKRRERLKERLKREKDSHFFMCGSQCIRVDFEQATNFEFKCPECGELMHQEDNQLMIIDIEKEIDQLDSDLKITP